MSSAVNASSPRTFYLLKRAETVIRTMLEARLQPVGVTPAQYVTLSLLSEREGQSSAELARKAGVTPQSMSETVATLTRKGLIARAESTENKRILITRLTDAGTMLLSECDVVVDALEAQTLRSIAPGNLEMLRQMLRSIAA